MTVWKELPIDNSYNWMHRYVCNICQFKNRYISNMLCFQRCPAKRIFLIIPITITIYIPKKQTHSHLPLCSSSIASLNDSLVEPHSELSSRSKFLKSFAIASMMRSRAMPKAEAASLAAFSWCLWKRCQCHVYDVFLSSKNTIQFISQRRFQ